MVSVDPTPADEIVVFYDGVCGLCNRLNRFLLARDRRGALRFAPLQGRLAAETLARYGIRADDLDTVHVISGRNTANARLLRRSRAVLHAVEQLGGIWRVAARIGALVPAGIADVLYELVARNRYRIFGRYEACALPPPEWRSRFLE